MQLRYNGAQFFMSTPSIRNDLLLGWIELNWIKVQHVSDDQCVWCRVVRPPLVSGGLGMCWKSCQKCDDWPHSLDSHLIPTLIALYHATSDTYFINHYSCSHVTCHPPPGGQTWPMQVQVQVHVFLISKLSSECGFCFIFHVLIIDICFDSKSMCFLKFSSEVTQCKWPLMLGVIWPVRLLVKGPQEKQEIIRPPPPTLSTLNKHYKVSLLTL